MMYYSRYVCWLRYKSVNANDIKNILNEMISPTHIYIFFHSCSRMLLAKVTVDLKRRKCYELLLNTIIFVRRYISNDNVYFLDQMIALYVVFSVCQCSNILSLFVSNVRSHLFNEVEIRFFSDYFKDICCFCGFIEETCL